MVAKETAMRERVVTMVASLPDEALPEVVAFLERQQARLGQSAARVPRFRPTPMGGLWQGIEITEADIADARREMRGSFTDD